MAVRSAVVMAPRLSMLFEREQVRNSRQPAVVSRKVFQEAVQGVVQKRGKRKVVFYVAMKARVGSSRKGEADRV